MFLDEILERNRAFVAGREARPLPPPERMRLAVVACYDPRLDPLLLPALGLAPGEAFLLRTAGALVQPGSSSLRSLGLAVFMFGVTEVLVVGHAACRMASFDSSSFIDAFRRRGVARETFGPEDLRTWAGAIPSPRQGVLLAAANIQAASFLPRDLTLAGVVLDEATGGLEVVLRSGEAAGIGVTAPGLPAGVPAAPDLAPGPEAPRATAQAAAPQPATPPRPTGGRPKPAAQAVQPAPATDPLVAAAELFAETLKGKAHWRNAVARLRAELDKPTNPLVKLQLLEAFAQRAGGEAKEVLAAFELLKEQAGGGRDLGPREAMEVLRHLSRKL